MPFSPTKSPLELGKLETLIPLHSSRPTSASSDLQPPSILFRSILSLSDYTQMELDLFKNLPSEIIIDILLRLPVRNIAISKCVCKPWLDLLSTDDFVKFHLAKSVPSLVFSIFERDPHRLQVFEFEDEVDDVESHDFGSNQVTMFDFPHKAVTVGAANGLLLLQRVVSCSDDDVLYYICNPITREYVELCRPEEEFLGFGASRISRQHKVVWINKKDECSVYTLETGSWRSVAVEAARTSLLHQIVFFLGAFFDGHLYWTVTSSAPPLVACFDLDTECFSSFSAPASCGRLYVVKDCLCFCECKDEFVMWLMKEKSWSKEYVIKIRRYYRASPINVYKNGDMLMLCDSKHLILFYNSNKTKAIQEIGGILAPEEFIFSIVFSLSFLSLKGLDMANVISF